MEQSCIFTIPRKLIECVRCWFVHLLKHLLQKINNLSTKARLILTGACVALIFLIEIYFLLKNGIASLKKSWPYFLLLCDGLVIIILKNLMEHQSVKQELRLIQEQKQMQYRVMKKQQANLDRLHMLQHDVQNHFLTIQGFLARGNKQSALEYIDAVVGQDAATADCYTDNILVDAILADTASYCKANGIAFRINGKLPAESLLNQKDLAILLFCLLEQALYGVGKGGNSHVAIEFSLQESSFHITVLSHHTPVDEDNIGRQLILKITDSCCGSYTSTPGVQTVSVPLEKKRLADKGDPLCTSSF